MEKVSEGLKSVVSLAIPELWLAVVIDSYQELLVESLLFYQLGVHMVTSPVMQFNGLQIVVHLYMEIILSFNSQVHIWYICVYVWVL